MLECHGLTCAIGGRTILSDVGLRVDEGRMMAIVGRNGSGKSTLIHSLIGLSAPVRGTSSVNGQSIRDLSARQRARYIAYVGQEETPPEDLLVGEMVAMGRIPHRPPWALDTAAERDLVLEALSTVGMVEKADRRCNQLSGGERRRVMLARGLAQGSPLLVLDEPTNHLDVHHQLQLLTTVRGLGRTVFAAMHDLSLAAAFFDDIAVLHDGGLLTVGPPSAALHPRIVEKVFDVPAARIADPTNGRHHLVLGPGAPSEPPQQAERHPDDTTSDSHHA